MQYQTDISAGIKLKASELGFLECAILPSTFLEEEKSRYEKWLKAGMHGEMGYMERNIDKRLDPGLLFEGAKSLVIVLQNYYPAQQQQDEQAPILSKYAYGNDYHYVIREKLRKLLEYI